MNAHAKPPAATIARHDPALPILTATGPAALAIRAGTMITVDGRPHAFEAEAAIDLPVIDPGHDYGLRIGEDGIPVVDRLERPDPIAAGYIAGFHFALGGNAAERKGGDTVPAVNPHSIWDLGFRPSCADPRGMTRIAADGLPPFWFDIYLLATDHLAFGTSRCGAKIADGRSLDRLDYRTAVDIMAAHGKRLPTHDEFRAAAFGVTEKSAVGHDPDITGLDAARTSRFGLMQATGNLWIWGTDGDPDEPRPSLFGGSWVSGGDAGSRFASLGCHWPGDSSVIFSSRGACDHLAPV